MTRGTLERGYHGAFVPAEFLEIGDRIRELAITSQQLYGMCALISTSTDLSKVRFVLLFVSKRISA